MIAIIVGTIVLGITVFGRRWIRRLDSEVQLFIGVILLVIGIALAGDRDMRSWLNRIACVEGLVTAWIIVAVDFRRIRAPRTS